MAHTVDEYGSLLKNLLPPGTAFPREPGTNIEKVLLGAAVELSRVESRGDTLAIEVNPLDTNELLADWERAAGLPDKCSNILEPTIQGRRNALIAKLTSTGGQSIEYFQSVAKALGFEVTVTEYRPFQAGISKAGGALTNGDWIYAWRLNLAESTIIEFKAGLSAAGEPLRSWGNDILECKMNQIKPAHTVLLFGYGVLETLQLAAAADFLFYVANYVIPTDLEII